MKEEKNKKGYVLLYSVIILGIVALAMALYLSWLGVFSLQNKKDTYNSKVAHNLAESCAELALMDIWNDPNASGITNKNNLFGSGDCLYSISGNDEEKTIESTGIINNITRKTKVSVDQIKTNINIISWREVPDF